MTLLDIVTTLTEIAKNKPNINYVGSGDIYQLNSLPSIDYSVFFITQNTHNWDIDTTQFSLNLYYIDRLLKDRTNAEEIQTAGMLQLQNSINTLYSQFEDVEIDYPVQFTPFYHRFADECAGVFATITITVPSSIGLCYQ